MKKIKEENMAEMSSLQLKLFLYVTLCFDPSFSPHVFLKC